MENKFEKCCGLGKSWANEGLKCEKFIGPVSGLSEVEQGLCLEAVDICCNRVYHEISCKIGKKRAKEGLGCTDETNKEKENNHYQKDCCEGCKLGILTGSMGQGCTFDGFSFGIPWDPAFMECCHETKSPSITTTMENVKPTTVVPIESTSSSSSSDLELSLEFADDDNSTSGNNRTKPWR